MLNTVPCRVVIPLNFSSSAAPCNRNDFFILIQREGERESLFKQTNKKGRHLLVASICFCLGYVLVSFAHLDPDPFLRLKLLQFCQVK